MSLITFEPTDRGGPEAVPRPGKKSTRAVALARLGQRTVAYVADEDDRSIRTMDIDSKQVIARTALEGSPAQLMILADGRVAAALRDKNRVQVLEPDATVDKPLASLCSV